MLQICAIELMMLNFCTCYKTEADSNDSTECSHDDRPSTGMFALSSDIFSAVSCVYGELASEGQ